MLAAFNKDHQEFCFLRFTDQRSGREWLSRLLDHISVTKDVETFNERFSRQRRALGRDPDGMAATWVGISFTLQGLEFLASDQDRRQDTVRKGLEAWDQALVDGAAARAEANGDTGRSATTEWMFGHNQGVDSAEIHAVVITAADLETDLTNKLRALTLDGTGDESFDIIYRKRCRTLEKNAGHEHFGFKDGISQPGVRQFHQETGSPDNPEREGHPGTPIVEPGEFVIGWPDQSGRTAPHAAWLKDGSLQVVRQLSQDVPGFRDTIAQLAGNATPPTTSGAMASLLVGRHPDGTPLAPVPAGPENLNDFDYADDPTGTTTPCVAHIRKTNQRASLPRLRRRHTIMRRGIPYGPEAEPDEAPTSEDVRGLMFVAYNAKISGHFEILQQLWCDNVDFPPDLDAPKGSDPIVGIDPTQAPDTGVISITAKDPRTPEDGTTPAEIRLKMAVMPRHVHTRGTLYCLTPSVATLCRLADGEDLS